jgi:hypothetical protein
VAAQRLEGVAEDATQGVDEASWRRSSDLELIAAPKQTRFAVAFVFFLCNNIHAPA